MTLHGEVDWGIDDVHCQAEPMPSSPEEKLSRLIDHLPTTALPIRLQKLQYLQSADAVGGKLPLTRC